MSEIEKGWKGEPGDKRNTKYAGAAAAGLPLAGPIGSAAGVAGYAMYRNMSETGKKRRAMSIKAKKQKLSKSAFGVEHEDAISKGSPKLGLRMINAYGKKPTESMANIKRATVGQKPKKRDNSLGDSS